MELPDVPLFRGLTADEAEAAVTALRMRRRAFAKGEILLEAGQRAPALGVVSRCGSALWPQKTARHCFWRPGSFCSAAASHGAGS